MYAETKCFFDEVVVCYTAVIRFVRVYALSQILINRVQLYSVTSIKRPSMGQASVVSQVVISTGCTIFVCRNVVTNKWGISD